MVRIPSDLLPPPADRSGEPLYALPGRLLAAGWAVAACVAIGGWFVVARIRTIEPETLRWGVL